MFKKVGKAGLAAFLVGRSDLVPHHVRDDRRPPVWDDDDLQPVAQRAADDLRNFCRNGGQAEEQCRQNEDGDSK